MGRKPFPLSPPMLHLILRRPYFYAAQYCASCSSEGLTTIKNLAILIMRARSFPKRIASSCSGVFFLPFFAKLILSLASSEWKYGGSIMPFSRLSLRARRRFSLACSGHFLPLWKADTFAACSGDNFRPKRAFLIFSPTSFGTILPLILDTNFAL